jgi:hypothetical protein
MRSRALVPSLIVFVSEDDDGQIWRIRDGREQTAMQEHTNGLCLMKFAMSASPPQVQGSFCEDQQRVSRNTDH